MNVPVKPTLHKKIVIFDMDSTLANCDWRLHYIASKPKNWKAFFKAGINDPQIEGTCRIFRLLREAGMLPFIVTARPETLALDATVSWLENNDLVPWRIYMRPDNDRGPDHVVKENILYAIWGEYGSDSVSMAFDDKDTVVNMYRMYGIYTFDVSQKTSGVINE